MNDSSPLQKIHALLKDFSTAMLVTHTDDHPFHARPMEVAWVSPENHVWFFTSAKSAKVDEIQEDQDVLLTFQDDHQKYITLTGYAELITDREKMADLWKESYRVWFPGDLEDPNLLLVRVIPREAEYWDNSGTKGVRYLYEAAKAYLQGTTPEVEEGEVHGRVRMA